MPNLYIIAGCNGAGKTTASFTVLPEMLDCKEFINADEIARGLSPFQPEKVAIEAGKIMRQRIAELLANKKDFAFETTLAAKSYVRIIKEAQQCGYFVTLVFFWLNSPELAVERVKTRYQAGGHNVETMTILRRYRSGILNLFDLYIPISDYWLIIDNSNHPSKLISEGKRNNFITTYDNEILETLKSVQK
jgi:predicted ABC-type ATPase